MVKIKDLLKKGIAALQNSVSMPSLEAELFLAHILGKDRLYVLTFGDTQIEKEEENAFYKMCERRALGEPSAYIIGEKEFMSLNFKVNPSVLIPRPETELLVEHIIEKYSGKSISILDLCTGSGAIAVSLAHFLPNAKILATDISDDALCVAKANAEINKVQNRVSFVKADALLKTDFGQRFDLLVSNPPYIESAVIPTLDKDVKDFEPREALDGGDDGLIFYKNIVDNIDINLRRSGELCFEIGFNQADSVCDIMKSKFESIKVIKDLAGLDRIVTGQLR